MNLQETPTERAFRTRVRHWMQENLCGEFEPLRGGSGHGPGSPGYDSVLAKRWERRLASGGWIGQGWPRHSGGCDLPLAQQMIFHEEYVRSGGPARLSHIGEQLLAPTLMAFGTSDQQERFLPGIRAATTYWAQGYSEPGAGSDLANVQTRARLDDATRQWVIDGQKVWTSWAHEADWIFMLVRCEPGSTRHHGLVLLLVPLHQSGITIRPIRQITGGTEFSEIFFDGARTEAPLHLGAPGQGWKVALALLGFERGVSTLGQQAQFRQELERIVAVARNNGAARDPLLRQRIARAALGLHTLRCNALRMLGGNALDPELPGEALTMKYAWSNWRRELGELAIDVLGNVADFVADPVAGQTDPDATNRQRLQQLSLASRADTIYAGSNEIQLNLIAEHALGMPR